MLIEECKHALPLAISILDSTTSKYPPLGFYKMGAEEREEHARIEKESHKCPNVTSWCLSSAHRKRVLMAKAESSQAEDGTEVAVLNLSWWGYLLYMYINACGSEEKPSGHIVKEC